MGAAADQFYLESLSCCDRVLGVFRSRGRKCHLQAPVLEVRQLGRTRISRKQYRTSVFAVGTHALTPAQFDEQHSVDCILPLGDLATAMLFIRTRSSV